MLFPSVQGVPEDELTFVFVMAGGKDANLKGVGKVHREALISVRHMVEGRDVPGVTLVLNLAKAKFLAAHLLELKWVSVHLTGPLFRIKEFMVVQLWELSPWILNPINLLKQIRTFLLKT